MSDYRDSYIMVNGNPVEGFAFTGPFNDRDDAVRAGDSVDSEWWIADLTMPDEYVVEMIGKVSDVWAMDRLAEILAGEFSADTYDELVELLESTGRKVADEADEG